MASTKLGKARDILKKQNAAPKRTKKILKAIAAIPKRKWF